MAFGAANLAWWGKVLPVLALLLQGRPCHCQPKAGGLRGGSQQTPSDRDAVASFKPTLEPDTEGLQQLPSRDAAYASQPSQAPNTAGLKDEGLKARRLQSQDPTINPYAPRTSFAWPLKNWTLQLMMEQGYPVLPCVNFRYVTASFSSACRKRMPAPKDQAQQDERTQFYSLVHGIGPIGPGSTETTAAADWALLQTDAGDFRQEIRVGLTVSRTGSLKNKRLEDQLLNQLGSWATEHVQHVPGWCFTFCVLDDASSKQRVRDIYGHFAWSETGYDVDILLGPQRYELREEAAMIASTFSKPMLLWSYPSQFYDLALGSTNDVAIDQDLMDQLTITLTTSNWSPGTSQSLAVYISYQYHVQGGNFPAVVVQQGLTLSFGRSTQSLVLSVGGTVRLDFRIRRGLTPKASDPVNGTTYITESQIEKLPPGETVPMQLPLSGQVLRTGVPIQLGVTLRKTVTPFKKFYAQEAEKFKVARQTELEQIKDVERSVLEANTVGMAELKFSHTGSFSGPNAWHSMSADLAEMTLLANSVKDPVIHKAGSAWHVQGPCQVDAEDCLTSPNYPSDYGNTEICVASLDSAATQNTSKPYAVLTDFDTERLHDMLWLSGQRKFYSGQETLQLESSQLGQIVWQSDISVVSRGWRLCLSEVELQWQYCTFFMCPDGYRKKVEKWHICGSGFFNTGGFCKPEDCCEYVPVADRNSSGHLWMQGFDSVYDITVPVSEWLKDPLRRLHSAGAQVLGVATSATEWPQCRDAQAFAWEVGFHSPRETHTLVLGGGVDWIDYALTIDFRMIPKPDVLLICGDGMTVTSLITALISMRIQVNAVLLAQPLGSSLQLNSLPSSSLNYIIEPLPWPSVEWMLSQQTSGFVRWTAYLLESRNELANLQTIQMEAVIALLEYALSGYQSSNSSVITQRLSTWQESDTPTLMGPIRFLPDGQRVTPCTVGTTQRKPLPKSESVEPFDSSIHWNYWYARFLFSEHRILVNSTLSFERLLDAAKLGVEQNVQLLTSDDWLEMNGFVPEADTLNSRNLPPHTGMVSELTYPKPSWSEVHMEARACPVGCDHQGHQCVACPPGKFRGTSEEHCRECPAGRQSTIWAASVCEPCPFGAVCLGRPSDPAEVLPGYWRGPRPPGLDVDAQSCSIAGGLYPEDIQDRPPNPEPILSCAPLSWLCAGGVDNKCWGHNTGVLCRVCPAGYSWMNFGPAKHECSPCSSFAWVFLSRIFPITLLYTAIVCLLNFAVRKGSRARNSIVTPTLRLVFEHLTTQNFIVESMGLGETAVFVPVADFLTRPLDVLSLDCFIAAGDTRLSHIKQVRAQLIAAICLVVAGVLSILAHLLFRSVRLEMRVKALMLNDHELEGEPGADGFKRMHIRHKKQDFFRHASRYLLIWLYITFPPVLRVGILPFVCIDAGEPGASEGLRNWRVESSPDIPCDDPDYNNLVKPLARGIIGVYLGVLLPALFFYLVNTNRFTNTVFLHQTAGLFFQGYRRPFYWFEIVLIMRWILQLASMLFPDGVPRGTLMVVIFVSAQIIEENCNPYVPLDQNALKSMFGYSFRVHMTTLMMGLLLQLPMAAAGARAVSNTYVDTIYEYQVIIVIVLTISNSLFLLWVSYVLWYDQAIVPVAIVSTSVGSQVLLPFQRARLAFAKRFRGINELSIKTNGEHHTLELIKLQDSERKVLLEGIMNSLDNILRVRNYHFCTQWILQVLKASFDMVLKDHRARILDFHNKEHFRSEGRAQAGRAATPTSAGDSLKSVVRNLTPSQRVMTPVRSIMTMMGLTPGENQKFARSNSDLVLRESALVDEVAVALVNVGSDLQDSMLKLSDFESTKNGGPGEARAAHHLKRRGITNVDDESAEGAKEEEEGNAGPKYFTMWQAELREAQRDRHASSQQLLLPRVEGSKHTKPDGKTVLSMIGRTATSKGGGGGGGGGGRGAFPQLMDHFSEEDEYDITITPDSSDEEDMPGFTSEVRRAHLRNQILEARSELRTLQVKLKMQQDSDYKVKSNHNFLANHMPYSQAEGQQKLRRATSMSARSDASSNEAEEEHVDNRGQDGVFARVLSSINQPGSADKKAIMIADTEEPPEVERENEWYGAFVGKGGGGPAAIPTPKRAPMPPPLAPPPSGAQRVVFGRAPAPLGDSCPAPEAETPALRPMPKSPARSKDSAKGSVPSTPLALKDAAPQSPEKPTPTKSPHKVSSRQSSRTSPEWKSPGEKFGTSNPPRPTGPRAVPATEISRPSASSDDQETTAASSSGDATFDV